MPKTRPPYPDEFRNRIVELVRNGRTPSGLAEEFEPTEQTIRNWIEKADRDDGKSAEGLVPVRAVIRRVEDEDSDDPFLILATPGIDPAEATEFYERRWDILALFAALKSRGFDLEETRVTDPDKVENLVGLLVLAFGWTRLVGEERAAREGPPTTKSHGRKERSLFRYGLDRLQNIFSTPEPQVQAFLRCLSVFRSPSALVVGRQAAAL